MVKNGTIRKICVTAVMSTVGAVLMYLEFALPFVPSFLKFDFSELPALITSFAFGPLWGVLVCFIKNLLHIFFGSSFGVGELSNFILGAVFVFSAGIVYKKEKTRKSALTGCVLGSVLMAVVSVITNYYIVYPIYSVVFMPMDAILKMYTAVFPFIKSMWGALFIVNLPFTLLKGIADSLLCFVLYKKLSPILKGK